MLKEKENKKTFYTLIIILFIVIIFTGIIHINIKFPSYSCQRYITNQKFKYNNFEYEFKNFEILSNDEFLKKYDSSEIPEEEHINITVSVDITNISDEVQEISLEQFILETNMWSSNIGLYTFYSLNPNIKSTLFTIDPCETISLILPYNYFRLYDEKFSYELVSNKDFELCFYMNYPEKAVIDFRQ